MCDASGSWMCSEHISDRHPRKTLDHYFSEQPTPALDELSQTTAYRAAINAMCAMAVMAAMATLLSSTNIQDYSNWTAHYQDTFGRSRKSRLAGVKDELREYQVNGWLATKRSIYSMVFGLSKRNGWVMDHVYMVDVGRHRHNPRGALLLINQRNVPGMWFATTNSRDQFWQFWLWIHEVGGLIYCEDDDTLLSTVKCVPLNLHPWEPYSSTWEAVHRDLPYTGTRSQPLADGDKHTLEKCLQFILEIWTTISNFDTHTNANTTTNIITNTNTNTNTTTNTNTNTETDTDSV